MKISKFYEYELSVSREKKKSMGIVYTPIDVVSFINEATLANWTDDEIPKVFDPCVGTGIFLYDMAHKIAERWGISFEEACSYCYGYDIDKDAVKLAKNFLPFCNFKQESSLFCDWDDFDMVVTNPPYIRIQNLDEGLRKQIKETFSFCKGDTDIYMAFFQRFCEFDGISGFIVPNSWIKNKNAESLRSFLIESRKMETLIDFKSRKVFPTADAYTSVVVLNNRKNDVMKFSESLPFKTIAYDDIEAKRSFVFSSKEASFVDEVAAKDSSLFDVCDINVGLATLADRIYFLEVLEEKEKTFKVRARKTKYNDEKDFEIEKGIVKRCVKASDITKNVGKSYVIIYPYDEVSEFSLIKEDVLISKYPLAHDHLCENKRQLKERDKGKIRIPEEKWYAYGRSQAIKLLREKLLFAPLVSDKMQIKHSTPDELFISGYAIVPKNGTTLSQLEKLFLSEEVTNWIHLFGKNMSGGWLGVSKNTFKEYRVNKSLTFN